MSLNDYFEYEKRIGSENLIPWLKSHSAWPAMRVLDIGCGYGGTLSAIKAENPDCDTVGLDRDALMIREGRIKSEPTITLIHADFFTWKPEGRFDLILIRDVLEHIRSPEKALKRAVEMLAPQGRIYVSFAPFYGPFGGHQQNGSGAFSRFPWLQFLPEKLFLKLLPLKGNSYKGADALREDMASVLETRLTLKQFRKAARENGMQIQAIDQYLSRPDYRLKFGWPSCRLPNLGPLSELFATGVESLMQRHA